MCYIFGLNQRVHKLYCVRKLNYMLFITILSTLKTKAQKSFNANTTRQFSDLRTQATGTKYAAFGVTVPKTLEQNLLSKWRLKYF